MNEENFFQTNPTIKIHRFARLTQQLNNLQVNE